jgi:hypothetical protein
VRCCHRVLIEPQSFGWAFLRFTLILFTLLGMVSSSMLTGNEINPDSVSQLVLLAFETAVSAYGSHWLYYAVRWLSGVDRR